LVLAAAFLCITFFEADESRTFSALVSNSLALIASLASILALTAFTAVLTTDL
jgi:hypothetical protein